MSRDLPRNDIPILILAVLERGQQHGYAIAREIDARGGGGLQLRDGALYPALRSLEDEGLIVGEWEVGVVGRPAKKVYRLTDFGQQEATRRARLWRDYVSRVEIVLGTLGGQEVEPTT